MQLCRFHVPDQGSCLGLVSGGAVYDLTAADEPSVHSLGALLQASVKTPIRASLSDLDLSELPAYAYADLDRKPADGVPHLLPPVDRQEIWAAGVTYAWSREARVREAQVKDVYVRVYDADRPELFLKCLPEKAVGPNDWIGIRGDSRWTVPEPELTLVINPVNRIVGYTIGNDVSSRDIEGENPLYVPQAKIFDHGCALGPLITLADDESPLGPLRIQMVITRDGQQVFRGETDSGRLHRNLAGLAEYLGRYNDFPSGSLLLTGTGIVPPDDFTLADGDEVIIDIERIGVLRNVARQM